METRTFIPMRSASCYDTSIFYVRILFPNATSGFYFVANEMRFDRSRPDRRLKNPLDTSLDHRNIAPRQLEEIYLQANPKDFGDHNVMVRLWRRYIDAWLGYIERNLLRKLQVDVLLSRRGVGWVGFVHVVMRCGIRS
jgi:hypothetical protein